MATNRDFSAMLNEFLPNKLLANEMVKRDYFLASADKDNSWLGGTLIVPFEAAQESSVKFGSLTDSGDIGKAKFVRGSITNQPEVWGSLIFEERDLMEHGSLSEQNLLKILPGRIDKFLNYMKMAVSLSFTNGAHFALVTDATNAATGVMIVNRPERLVIGQKVIFDDNNSVPSSPVYVSTVDLETGSVLFVTTRYGATPADLSAYSVAQVAALYFDGHETVANRLSSLKSLLLSQANGGSATIYGVSKLAAPYTQAINVSGATITATNILDKLFDAIVFLRNRGAMGANKAVMSYKHWGSIMKVLETQKGAFRAASEMKASQYGWDEVDIAGPRGKLTVVAIQELDDDWIALMDMTAIKVYSNGFFKKRKSPEGKEYFEIRGSTGYQYIVDTCFFGDLVLEAPNKCGIIHTIAYA
jgi:hypothetical protein